MNKLFLFLIAISFVLTGCGNSDKSLFSDEEIVSFANKDNVYKKRKITYAEDKFKIQEDSPYATKILYPCADDLGSAKNIMFKYYAPRYSLKDGLPIHKDKLPVYSEMVDYFLMTHKRSSDSIDVRVFKCSVVNDLHIERETYGFERDENHTVSRDNPDYDDYLGILLTRPITPEVVEEKLGDFLKISFPQVGHFLGKVMETSVEDAKDYVQYNIYSVKKYRLAKIGIYTSYELNKVEYQINKESGEIRFNIKELKKIKRDWF